MYVHTYMHIGLTPFSLGALGAKQLPQASRGGVRRPLPSDGPENPHRQRANALLARLVGGLYTHKHTHIYTYVFTYIYT